MRGKAIPLNKTEQVRMSFYRGIIFTTPLPYRSQIVRCVLQLLRVFILHP